MDSIEKISSKDLPAHKCENFKKAYKAAYGHAVTEIYFFDKTWRMGNGEYDTGPISHCPFCGEKLREIKSKLKDIYENVNDVKTALGLVWAVKMYHQPLSGRVSGELLDGTKFLYKRDTLGLYRRVK